MSKQQLPADLVAKGSSPVFDQDSIPKALRTTHALGSGRWALLNVLEGHLDFTDEASGEMATFTAPAVQVIAPGAPHKLSIAEPVRIRLDFFAEEAAPTAPSAKHHESATPDRPDLDNADQIEALVHAFYARVAEDDLLGPVFVDQAAVDWDEHRRNLTAFWCKLELGLPGFNGAPTQKHSALSRETPFRAEQFERWVSLFHATVDSRWRGAHAESIKMRAAMIARAQSRMVEGAEPWTGSD